MRDVNNGWLIRYFHSNTASAFFFIVYLHIGRGLYYGSYQRPRTLTWIIGTIILILMIVTGFLGYEISPKWLYIILFSVIIYLIENIVVDKKYNKRNNKSLNSLNKKKYSSISSFSNINKREYSTTPSLNNSSNASERLNTIIKELNLIPVFMYENLDSETTRKQVLNETRGLSGIYMIVNKTTKDYYIGSASTNRLYARFCNHIIYFIGSKIVKLAVKKYGIEYFAFVILELYPNIVTKENNRELLDLEDIYLKLLLPNYNILTEAGSTFGYKHTEIDRKKMSDNYSEARKELIGNLNRGKELSAGTAEKMREKALNRPPMSDDIKNKCITNTRPVILYNLNGTIFGKYLTILDAAKAINCGEKTIRRALNTPKNLVKKQWIVKGWDK